ncbi:lymphokine-activated killer T-cell-originated protein kinase-like [Patiria miniata]|uniref:Protein kinase domain-containing protein n=1 Tax=Patiria miniata TaxID=46514 RepID=A0A913ZDJ0_PATMI|nr:lymphokine-activated killer T-cell-originated protein kinase-like [Patiria miniata]
MAAFVKPDDFSSPASIKIPATNRILSGIRNSSFTSPAARSSCSSLDSPLSGRVTAAIPPSPFMERIGYGTGVSVYLFQRGSKSDGSGLSPWAIKKTRARTCNNGNADNKQDKVEKMLAKEAQILKELKHDNIVGFRAFSRNVDGSLCLSMENGEQSLCDLIERRDEEDLGPFPASNIYHVALALARALNYLHNEKHILHGDLKSGNVLIGADFQSVKLCDFGVALKLEKDLTCTQDADNHYIGTEPWSAPEVIQEEGAVTDKADIFSYGLVLWEMMAVTLPHVHLLSNSIDDSAEDESFDESLYEARYQAALGTRPPLPDYPLSPAYNFAISLFLACTEDLPAKRPSASFIVELLESIPVPSDHSAADFIEDKENVPMD